MHDVFSRFNPGEMIGLVAVLGCVVCGLVAIMMGVGFAMRKQELLAGLKKSMLDRGMSADEIKMVIDAGSYDSLEHSKQLASHDKQPAYKEL
jgi:hypothetical protein